MTFGFVTCVQLGYSCMQEIYRAGGSLDLVVTLHDDLAPAQSGRVYVDSFCAERGILLVKCANVNDDDVVEAIRAAGVDWLFIIGWSQIARRHVLDAPRRGVLGMHPTLLPVGRGRAAIPWAILKGLEETGVTLFQLDEGVDTGPILAQHVIPVAERETAGTLYEKVNVAHRALIAEVWPRLSSGELAGRMQDDARATVWPGRRPEDGEVTADMTRQEVDRMVRALTEPYPGAFIHLDGRRLVMWSGSAHREDVRVDDPVEIPTADGVFYVERWTWEDLPAHA